MKTTYVKLETVLSTIFTTHETQIKHNIIFGKGTIQQHAFYILGTLENTYLGVDESIIITDFLLEILSNNDQLPILLLVDVIGQKLEMRDEWLGMYAYFAHVLECLHLVRKQGHRVFSLIYNQAIGGSFLAFGAMADHVFALTNATVAVMWLEAMSKITKIDESFLREISKTSPVFAPGVANFKQLGGVEDVLVLENVADKLRECLSHHTIPQDDRAVRGYQLGGRTRAYPIIEKIKAL